MKIILFLLILTFSLVVTAQEPTAYKRSDYMTGWTDEDGDCRSTRNEVLNDESFIAVTWDASGCKVVSGLWVDPYTGDTYTNPRDLEIDHTVALKNAHTSGAWRWSREKKKRFAQYLQYNGHMVAVSRSSNRSKGARDPAHWIPPNLAYLSEYLTDWTNIKQLWDLSYTDEEREAILLLQGIADGFEFSFKVRGLKNVKELVGATK